MPTTAASVTESRDLRHNWRRLTRRARLTRVQVSALDAHLIACAQLYVSGDLSIAEAREAVQGATLGAFYGVPVTDRGAA